MKTLQTFPKISDSEDVQAAYEAMRAQGQSHNISEMLATQQTPFLMTDSTWNEGRCNGNQFSGSKVKESLGDFYASPSRKRGLSLKGKTYMHALAQFPGDPEAWVSDLHDVRRVCLKRGLECKEAGTKAASPIGPPPSVDVAEDIVQEHMEKAIEKDPDLAKGPVKKRLDMREKIKDKLRPHWKKKQA